MLLALLVAAARGEDVYRATIGCIFGLFLIGLALSNTQTNLCS